MSFKEGDVVELKSGGPKMTIEKIAPSNFDDKGDVAHCVWFENGHMEDGKFPLTLLEVSEK